jgi:hypothetical protein
MCMKRNDSITSLFTRSKAALMNAHQYAIGYSTVFATTQPRLLPIQNYSNYGLKSDYSLFLANILV